MKRTGGDDHLPMGTRTIDHHRVRVWKFVDEVTIGAFHIASRFPQEEREGLSNQIKKTAALSGAAIAEWASSIRKDDDSKILKHAHSLMVHLRYYIYLARRLNFIEQKDYYLVIRKHEAASKVIEESILDGQINEK